MKSRRNLCQLNAVGRQKSARPAGLAPRRRTLEILEGRAMLAAGGIAAAAAVSWHNSAVPADVNIDGRVTPLDALMVINDLNSNGPRSLPGSSILAGLWSQQQSAALPQGYLDVSGDGKISSLDALMIINVLNDPPPSVRIRLVTRDLQGAEITTIPEGSEFILEARVLDLRTVDPTGVYSAYLDVFYDENLVSIDSGTTVEHEDPYLNAPSSDISIPGAIDETGSVSDTQQQLGPQERALWSLTMRADAAGVAMFDADPADVTSHEVLLYDENIDIPDVQIDYVDATLVITSDGPPTVSVADTSVIEGTGGVNNASFSVTLSSPPTEQVLVTFATSNDTATAPSDYTATTGTVTFDPGQQQKTIVVPIVTDALQEPSERFFVTLTGATGATLGRAQAIGTISNDDGIPTLTINDVTVAEGNFGNTLANFTVTLSTAPGTSQVTVGFSTTNGTALAGQDYLAQSGFLTFTGSETSKTIAVPVIGDTLNEGNEVFIVALSSASGAVLGDPSGQGTITDDDAAPSVSIADASVVEGNLGTRLITFDVTLSGASGRLTTVAFATANNTAVSPSDYDAQSGILTFSPGQVSKQVQVVVKGDTSNEGDENFFVNLSTPTNLTLARSQALGTITDDDGAPTLTITNNSVTEGNASTTLLPFQVSLSTASGLQVTVVVNTESVTATSPSDFQAIQNFTLTFAPGESTKTVNVTINGDVLDEANETFNVRLSQASGASIPSGQGVGIGTITDDDQAPTLTISDVTVAEGNTGTTPATFTLTLSAVSGQPVTVDFSTANGTATASEDYVAQSGSVTFDPGVLTRTITIDVNGDLADEVDEDFFVNLVNSQNVTVTDNQGRGVIQDDDAEPSLSITGVSVVEGDAGTTTATFVVTLSNASGKPVTVNFATANGTAISPVDYVAQSGVLTFAPGVITRTISVTINGDTEDEPNETFFVNLNAATNATIGNNQATGTILNDDRVPRITITDVSVVEGDTTPVNAVFTVNLSEAPISQVTVGFSTADNTATAGSDYTSASGVLTFAPGETSKTVTVAVLGDVVREGDETFFVNLSSAVGAAITDAQGIGTILDNEIERISIRDAVVVEKDAGTVNAVFIVTLSVALNQPVTVEFATANGTATSPGDYQATTGTITFDPGVTSRSITVPVNSDNLIEGNETFFVNLSNSSGPALEDAQGLGTIIDDDSDLPDKVRIRLAATDASGNVVTTLDPGDDFFLRAFVLDLRAPQGNDARGVAQAYLDVFYNETIIDVTGPVTFGPDYPNAQSGATNVDGLIDEVGALDGVVPLGPSERLLFSVPVRATGSGLGTFTADPADSPNHEVAVFGENSAVLPNQVEYVSTTVEIGSNAISVNDVSVVEGNAGTKTVTFTVSRFLPDGQTATVAFATSNGTAAAGQDYLSTSGVLTFVGSETTKTVTVTVLGDVLDENDETFFLDLSSATGGAGISDPRGTATIENDDLPPTVSINDAIGNEGTAIGFVVRLSTASGRTVTVAFATENSTGANAATEDVDYQATTGTVTFAPGATQQTITVPTLVDMVTEPNETFNVRLSNPNGTTLADSLAQGTIVNALPSRIGGSVYVDSSNDGVRDPNESGIQDVLITLINNTTGAQTTTLTGADGTYLFAPVDAGNYTVRETHPGFFADGEDTAGTPTPTGAPVNDRFTGIVITPGVSGLGFNFGERGLRAPFAAAFFNRRAFLASSLFTGPNGPNAGTEDLDLTRGDVWISFDSGWQGQRSFEATFLSTQGDVTLTLYDANLGRLDSSNPELNRARLVWNGAAGATYFLKISGNNPNVDLEFTDTPLAFSPSTGTPIQTNPVVRPLMASTSPELALADDYDVDADWVLTSSSSGSVSWGDTTAAATDAVVAEEDWLLDEILS